MMPENREMRKDRLVRLKSILFNRILLIRIDNRSRKQKKYYFYIEIQTMRNGI